MSERARTWIPWRRSLRTRLTILFVAFGLIPALAVGWAVLRNLTRNIDVWEYPGVTGTMEAVRVVARTSVNKLVSNLTVHARRTITDPELMEELARPELSPGARARLERLATETELDLVALFERIDDAWIERVAIAGNDVVFTSEDVDLALQLTSLQTGEQGYLVAAFPMEGGSAERALVVGYELGGEYLPYLESIAAGLTYYNQLRLVRQVTRESAVLAALAVTLVAVSVAFVLARWVARGVSRPVENLERAMHDLAAGEDARVEPRGTDELRYLSNAFNRMATELVESRRELTKAERLSAWQEMARRIAHEIRNPLTPIQFALHRLRRRADLGEAVPPEEILRSVNAIIEELDGLKSLAATFSEFARLPEPLAVPFPVNDLCRSVAGLLEGERVDVSLELSQDDPVVIGDRKGLRRVLTNLLKNAMESGASRIALRTQATVGSGDPPAHEPDARLGPGSRRTLFGEPHVVVVVEDDGPGVNRNELDRIFLPNYTTKPSGSGLGLAIVCGVIAQHGGALVVERLSAGGMRMCVHLPRAGEGSPPDGGRAAAERPALEAKA